MQFLRFLKSRVKRHFKPQDVKSVEDYWTRHVVNPKVFKSSSESLTYLQKRFAEHPLFREFLDLYSGVQGKTVMDYGSGPGDDVIGFLELGEVRKIYGVDVSTRGLSLTRNKIKLHGISNDRVELVHVDDKSPAIPIPSQVLDHIYSQGVLHHTSFPEDILKEFYRVLKPGGTGRIMVYQRESLWLHLYVAYVRMIEGGEFAGMDLLEAFRMSTDGVQCPISRCYSSNEFLTMLKGAGFQAKYLGGYFSNFEVDLFKTKLTEALASPNLAQTHKDFLRQVKSDAHGLPHIDGVYVGVGGSYAIEKPKI